MGRLWQEEKCRLFKMSQNYYPSIYSESIVNHVNYGKDLNRFNITGLGCKTNETLVIVAVDSLMYHHFAERLGVNISKKKDKTFAVIINDKVYAIFIHIKSTNSAIFSKKCITYYTAQ